MLSLVTCSVASKKGCKGKESASNLLTMESSSLPERGLYKTPLDGPELILGLNEIQKELVVAQQSNASVEQDKGELLLKEAPKEKNPHGSFCHGRFCEQFAVTERCGSDLIKGVSVPNCQSLSDMYGSMTLLLTNPVWIA